MIKRMLGIALLAMLALPFAATPSHAVDHAKQWALGYFFEDAPVGIRYMMTNKYGIDLGLGFQSEEGPDYASTDPGATKSNSSFNFELGVPINMVMTERANFFLRPSVGMKTIPYFLDNGTTITSESTTDLVYGVILGAEWHATDNLSLSFGHGLLVKSGHGTSPGEITGAKPESSTSVVTPGLTMGGSSIGFRWYF